MRSNRVRKRPTDQDLFQAIDTAIREERLYADNTLQRRDILLRFGLRRQHLNAILSQYAYGQSFPAYINTIRLKEAEKLLTEHPEMTITQIARTVGLSLANFRHLFRQRFGLTPSKFRG